MLRTRVLGASAAAVLAGSGAAMAADFPVYDAGPPAPGPLYSSAPALSWTGPYVGVTGGYGRQGGTVAGNGWIGGAYAGANFQTSTNLVVGVEGDVTGTGKTGTSGGSTVSNPWNTTIRGRVGYAVNSLMVYGTTGLAVGRVKATGTTSGASTRVGWTAGAGVEAALTEKVTGRLEYRYTTLGTATLTGGSVSYKSNDVMAGIGFKF